MGGSVSAGVGGIKTAIADPKKAAKEAVMGKPDKKKKSRRPTPAKRSPRPTAPPRVSP